MPEHSGIFYTDQGTGFPVIFIHGFCETHEIWNSFSDQLSKSYRVICLDLPGFGKSKLLQEGFSIADVSSYVLNFLTKIEIETCIVVGHSLGGYVTLEIAQQKPQILKGFCLFHSTAHADSGEKKISRNKVIEFVMKNGVTPFTEAFIPPLFYDSSNRWIPNVVRLASNTRLATLTAYVRAMRDRPDRTNVLRDFSKAVCIIGGKKDTGITPESLQKQAEMAPKASLHLLEDVAHMGMFENEELTIGKVNEFIQVTLANFQQKTL